MNYFLNKGENASNSCNINLVAQSDKIYIVDNHLVAFWCWLQLPSKLEYELIHIDRHYDLVPYNEVYDSGIHNFNWENSMPEDLTSLKTVVNGFEYQIIRWDNCINLFKEIHPNFFRKTKFITQKNGTFNYNGEYEEKEIHEIVGWCIDKTKNVILNLDIDYFFTNIGDSTIQKYTDSYIDHVAEWVYEEYNNFTQIIFCLSPECSISWEEAKRITNIFLTKFDLKI
ncbi:MAG: hypothetical protein JNL24_04615 [Bacteroidia bacterium]|nr:hypothetical protein [Bacteroidia bacterium]